MQVVADATGCGKPVTDLLRKEITGCGIIGVSIHGGDGVTHTGRDYRAPKRDLVATLTVLLQSTRLQFSPDIPALDTLKRELLNFKAKIDPATAHESFSA